MRALNAAAHAQAEAAGVVRVYPVGEVPAGGDRVYPYAVLSVSVDGATTHTLDAHHSVQMMRITTQAFGRSMNAALDIDDRLRSAFMDRRLTTPGLDCGPAVLQVGGVVQTDPDAGQVIGITSTYRFAATKEP